MRLISTPVLCNYYVTYRCNASCGFCDIWEKPSPYVTLDTVRENLKALKKLGVKVIDFTGGEPLLHREIDLLLEEAKKLKLITTLTTNTLLFPKWAERIKGKVDMLHFSLDSSEAEKHDESRGVKCFDSLIESIRIAKSLGERPDILFTVFQHNISEIEKIYNEITVPNDLVLILNPVFDYKDINAGGKLSSNDLKSLSEWGKKKGVYLNDGFIKLRRDGGNQINNPVCKAGSTTIVISPENKLIMPCYHLGLKEFPINNNLESLYHSLEVREMIGMEGKYKECQGCTINCYMQPSFAVEMNSYWFAALPSTIKYNRMKGTWKKLFA